MLHPILPRELSFGTKSRSRSLRVGRLHNGVTEKHKRRKKQLICKSKLAPYYQDGTAFIFLTAQCAITEFENYYYQLIITYELFSSNKTMFV